MRPVRKVLCLLLLLCGTAARADLAAGRAALKKGEWKAAEAALQQAPAADRGAALLALAELCTTTGRYSEALQHAEAAAQLPAVKAAALTQTGEVQRRVGRTAEAIQSLRAAVTAAPKEARARVLLGTALLERGDRAAGEPLLRAVLQEAGPAPAAGAPDPRPGEALYHAGIAAARLGLAQEANRLLQRAAGKLPDQSGPHCEWGELFLSRYRPDEADTSFNDALKVNPKDPRALTGKARAQWEGRSDRKKALEWLEKALQENPQYVPALTLQARVELDDEGFAKGEALLKRALGVNAADLEARAYLAASRYLQGDQPGYERERQAALQTNPQASGFYYLVGELAVRHHLYEEAVALNRQAMALNPKDADALAAFGLNLLRLGPGQETEALKALSQAFDLDPFNARTLNLLNLYEDVFPKAYDTFTAAPFVLRVPKTERPLLARYVPAALLRAWEEYRKKYSFTPRTPIAIELFTQRQHYGARTTGLPDLGAQGTCFGQLITAMSPAAAEANWELVLSHELAHVFHLQLSRNRVARWFTEGLAEYETNVTRPYWRREHARDLYLFFRQGRLWKIEELSQAFTQPDRPNGVLLAYYQSSLVIHYLVETAGFPKVAEALKLYGAGQRDEQVLTAVTGKSLTELNAGFRKFLEARLAHLTKGFFFDVREYADRDRWEAAVRANGQDPAAHAGLAAALLGRDADAALAAARKALELEPTQPLARFVAGAALERKKEAKAAAGEYERLLAEGVDGHPIRMALARISSAQADYEGAVRHLEAARRQDPEDAQPLSGLMEMYEKLDRREPLLQAMEAYLDIHEHDHDTARLLVDRLALDQRWADVIRVAPRVLEITPNEGFVHQQYGRALAIQKRPKEAAFELESALLSGLRRPAPTRALLARQWLLLGDRVQARAAAEQALKEEPNHPEATRVLAELK